MMGRGDTSVRLECRSLPRGAVVRKLTGREGISELYAFDLDVVVVGDDQVDAAPLLGERATIVFARDGHDVRSVHGLFVEVRQRREALDNATALSLRLAPGLFQATLFETQEVFLDQSVPAIFEQKLDRLGETLVKRLEAKRFPARDLVVQLAESDLAFVSRLAEHVGLSFFFEQGDDRETTVLTDATFPDHDRPIAFLPRGDRRGGVWSLETATRLIPAAYILQEWNYRSPLVDLTASHASDLGATGGVIEFGAHYKTVDEGTALARVRAEEREATHRVQRGESDVCELSAGYRYDLDGESLLVVEVDHSITQAVGLHGDKDVTRYENRFVAIPAERAYRPPRRTPRPRVHGLLSGIVVDAMGSETGANPSIDEHGRYLVRLLFDAAGAGERRASHPIRMVQPLAGAGYGMHFPLRPGAEVAIGFSDGDPDRPVILGSIPNHMTPSPVARDNALKSTIKTATGILVEMKDK